ncbi:LysR family transcriptional regulator [Vibrio breoganii]|uniref:LysR family transcriptional regulator n=2 Tax=Vibrio breoganii TaxID=553239 RepID=UPI000CC8DE77|nr:LysR family transcriptional regulator [Vibrio breoganii]PMG04532.1 hypothetical protein BCV00_15050 [Vibrio breoganii]PMG82159.1 hypothetical protein BCU81_16510 [Vibrio breoganii]PMI16221.1 hypothetical protein BCU49_14730 [Vibrio breoganii]PML79062.1 hypothetical protein BCT68_17005 [Vibrio breoganii]
MTKSQQLNQLDLNLLRLLAMLVKTNNTQLAAKNLGISQASASRGLGKLREAFGQSLFTRKSHGLIASPLAIDLAEQVGVMLLPFEQVLQSHQQFDPNTYAGELNIVVERSTLSLIGESLSHHLIYKLPFVDFNIVGWGTEGMNRLLSGEYHYGLQSNIASLPKSLYTNTLIEFALGVVGHINHPALASAKQYIDQDNWQKLNQYPFVRMILPMLNTIENSHIEMLLKQLDINYRMQLKSDDIQVLISHLLNSDALWVGGTENLHRIEPRLKFCAFQPQAVTKLQSVYLSSRRKEPLFNFLDEQIKYFFDN